MQQTEVEVSSIQISIKLLFYELLIFKFICLLTRQIRNKYDNIVNDRKCEGK